MTVEQLTQKSEYNSIRKLFNERFFQNEFEKNPFNEKFKLFVGCEFDFIFHELFFEGIKAFLGKLDDTNLIFYTIDPSPNEYFKHFKKYNILNISINATDAELNEIMMAELDERYASALAIWSNEISWFSQSNEWAIFGSREWEIAIVGFVNLEVKQKFIQSFSDDAQTMFTSIETQVSALDEMLKFDKETKSQYKKLIQCYQDKTSS
jgi:hypothetical protein